MGPTWVQFGHNALILPIWDPFAHACWANCSDRFAKLQSCPVFYDLSLSLCFHLLLVPFPVPCRIVLVMAEALEIIVPSELALLHYDSKLHHGSCYDLLISCMILVCDIKKTFVSIPSQRRGFFFDERPYQLRFRTREMFLSLYVGISLEKDTVVLAFLEGIVCLNPLKIFTVSSLFHFILISLIIKCYKS